MDEATPWWPVFGGGHAFLLLFYAQAGKIHYTAAVRTLFLKLFYRNFNCRYGLLRRDASHSTGIERNL
ncbi:hypothetical protein [Vogesella sp. AC12]|uniref:hypothetical protein n=1 Tax=Vogesella sp. AC12 TaxID=2950550 RepID=UPI00210AA257|nr:hypothetical protein [Vogesella sp. AC12]MCQ4144758.1 hypothetical protein [Vogesella sp. AC12]